MLFRPKNKFGSKNLSTTLSALAILTSFISHNSAFAHPGIAVKNAAPIAPAPVMVPEVYEQAYFNARDPQTALDMVYFIPGAGAAVSGGGGGRGLGSGSERLLINGKKISGKSTGARTVLSRLSPGDIKHILVFRDGAEHLGVAGGDVVVNVILDNAKNSLSGRWEAKLKSNINGKMNPEAKIVINHRNGEQLITFSANANLHNSPNEEHRALLSAAGDTLQTRERDGSWNSDQLNLSAGYDNTFSEDTSVSLNGTVRFHKNKSIQDWINQDIDQDALIEPITLTTLEDRDYNEDNMSLEVTANLDTGFIKDTRLNVTVLQSLFDKQGESTSAETIEEVGVDASRSLQDRTKGETVARATFTGGSLGNWAVRYGAEGAYNFLHKDQEEWEGETLDDLSQMIIDNASGEVDEMRGEIFATATKDLSKNTSLEVGNIYEFSNIRQEGESVSQSRKLAYMKPSVQLRHELNDKDQIRINVERRVGQLNFDEFISSVNQDEDRVNYGNPDLVPTKRWRLAALFEHQFPENRGNIHVKAFHQWIEDEKGRLPFDGASATGNIGNASRYGVELKGSYIWRGDKETKVNLRIMAQNSKVMDPFVHEYRRTSGLARYEFNASFNRAEPELGIRYGGSFYWRSKKDHHDYDRITTEGPGKGYLNAFVEKRLNEQLKLSLNMNNMLSNDHEHEIYDYGDARVLGVLDTVETRSRRDTARVILSLTGQF